MNRIGTLAPLMIALSIPGSGQPNLTAFGFTPNSIDTTKGAANVTVSFTATDRTSAIVYFETSFVDASGGRFQRGSKTLMPAQSVSSFVTIPFPAFGPGGAWTVASIFLIDQAGNSTKFDTTAIGEHGFPTALHVLSPADTVPPTLTSLSLSSNSIDTTLAAARVAVNFTASDDKSGVATVQVNLASPSGVSSPNATVRLEPALTATGAASFSFPRFSEEGTWTVTSVYLEDAAGNTQILKTSDLAPRGFPTAIYITSKKDTQAPVLTRFSFTPTSIDTKGEAVTVLVSFQLTDDLSGATTFQAGFLSPSGANRVHASAVFEANVSVTGTAKVVFPRGSESGTWTVSSVFIADATGNTSMPDTADLVRRGFPTQVIVTNDNDPAHKLP